MVSNLLEPEICTAINSPADFPLFWTGTVQGSWLQEWTLHSSLNEMSFCNEQMNTEANPSQEKHIAILSESWPERMEHQVQL